MKPIEDWKITKPLYQFLILAVVVLILTYLLSFSSSDELLTPWLGANYVVLIYCVFNVVIGFLSNNMSRYFVESMLSFGLILLVAGGLAWFFTGESIFERPNDLFTFKLFVMVYLVMTSFMLFIRKAMSLARQQEEKMKREQFGE